LAAADDLVLLDAAPDDVVDESVAVGGGAA
jgi:hypothetical protein